MKFTYLLPFILFITTTTFAAEKMLSLKAPNNCGTYEINGIIKLETGKMVLSIFDQTKSQINLMINETSQSQAKSFFNKPVKIYGTLKKRIHSYQGMIEVDKIESRISNPLRPDYDSGFKTIEEKECEK